MNFKKIFNNKKNIILALILVVIIAGVIVKCTSGMNYALTWKNSSSIIMYIDNSLNEKDMKQILKDVFPKTASKVQFIDKSESEVFITIDKQEITDEEKTAFVEKINERYEDTLTIEELKVVENGHVRLIDYIKQFEIEIVIAIVIIVMYYIIRYRKINTKKLIEYLVEALLLPELLFFSILTILRIPVGVWTIPTAVCIFIITFMVLTYILNKENKKIESKKNKKRK